MTPLPGHDVCRVCGFRPHFLPYGADGMSASYEFCSSCGVKFGYNDRRDEEIAARRQRWLAGGPAWTSTISAPPADWQPLKQLQTVPDHFRFAGETCWEDDLDADTGTH